VHFSSYEHTEIHTALHRLLYSSPEFYVRGRNFKIRLLFCISRYYQ